MELHGKWIWFAHRSPKENMVGCFVQPLPSIDIANGKVELRITAETRYVVCVNGYEIGRGPIRSYPDTKYFDTYNITSYLKPGENLISVRVWDYGWSTYQTIAGSGGLLFDVIQNGKMLAASGEQTRAMADPGHRYNTVKRNVNLGFMEYHDARKSAPFWQVDESVSRNWQAATVIESVYKHILPRPIPTFSTNEKLPQQVVAARKVKLGCQQVSINTRHVFFSERKDACDTIFSGFLGVILDSPASMEGRIAFPNRTWNGIIGDFRIGDTLYEVNNANRNITVQLKKGKQLFLLQISGKYDDLFCHIEFHFPKELSFDGLGETGFFVIGPTTFIPSLNDGKSRVYGGLDEYDRLEEHTPEHNEIFACTTLGQLQQRAELIPVSSEYVFYDEYIYSLVHGQKICQELPITPDLTDICHGNDAAVQLEANDDGSCHQLIIDFGDIYVGSLEFTLNAPSGTVLDLYGFENFYENKIDFTVGLNNSIRYICREGMQTFRSMTRIGCRYLALTFSNQSKPVEISGLSIHHSTYPPSGLGNFRCNDNTLNRIWEMCRQTHICCMEDTFTDCPTYEQAYWIGDALISAYINAWLFGEYPLMQYCLTLASKGFYTTSLLNALLPTDWNTSIPMWSMNWLLAIEQYIKVSGDEEVLDELYPAMIRLMDTFQDFVTPEGGFLINAWNMLDWAALDIYNHCVVSGQQAILVHCFRICAGYAAYRGDNERAKKYTQTSQKLMEYIDKVLWDEERQVFLDGWSPEHGLSKTHSIQTHSLMITYDAIVDPNKKKRAQDIVDNPREDTIQVGSPFFLFYVYELWAQQDFSKVLEDIRERWQGMMRYNCTTCWEVFPGFYEVGRTRSYCHSWSASPVYFFGKYMLGVHPKEQAFKRVEILLPEVDIEWCEGSVPTPYGAIRVSWSREGNQRICQVVAPKTITVDIPTDTDWDIRVLYFDA